jgi:hypothetical protein
MTVALSFPCYADRLAFEGTTPWADNQGTCVAPVIVQGRGADLLVYWSAVKGSAYYFSIVYSTRGWRWYVSRDNMPPGKYRVSVYSRKLTPGAVASCVATDSISTQP